MPRPALRRAMLAAGLALAGTAAAQVPHVRIPPPKVAFVPFEYVCRRAAGR